MKTSNKILLTTFITVLLVLTVIHVALNQRYKQGQFTVKSAFNAMDTIALKPVKFVKVDGLQSLAILHADSYRIELEKNMPSTFKHAVSGDTLIISGGLSDVVSADRDQRRVHQDVRIYLPAVEMISVRNTDLLFAGSADSSKPGSLRIELVESKLSFRNYREVDNPSGYYGDVSVTAKDQSAIELAGNKIFFNWLSVDLENSVLRENATGDIKKFSVKADDSSIVQVGGSSFKKLNTVAKD